MAESSLLTPPEACAACTSRKRGTQYALIGGLIFLIAVFFVPELMDKMLGIIQKLTEFLLYVRGVVAPTPLDAVAG